MNDQISPIAAMSCQSSIAAVRKQVGHTGLGGQRSSPQPAHRCMTNRRSRAACQKGAVNDADTSGNSGACRLVTAPPPGSRQRPSDSPWPNSTGRSWHRRPASRRIHRATAARLRTDAASPTYTLRTSGLRWC